jgi:hypothetical protein
MEIVTLIKAWKREKTDSVAGIISCSTLRSVLSFFEYAKLLGLSTNITDKSF